MILSGSSKYTKTLLLQGHRAPLISSINSVRGITKLSPHFSSVRDHDYAIVYYSLEEAANSMTVIHRSVFSYLMKDMTCILKEGMES